MRLLGFDWTISDMIQAVSAVLSLITLLAIFISLRIANDQAKQSVMPLLLPVKQSFTLFYSKKFHPYIGVMPFVDREPDFEEGQMLHLSMGLSNLGVGAATSIKIEWESPGFQLKEAAQHLSSGAGYTIEAGSTFLSLEGLGGNRSVFLSRTGREYVDELTPQNHSASQEQRHINVPAEILLVALSDFQKMLGDEIRVHNIQPRRYRLNISCKDLSSRSVKKRYFVTPKFSTASLSSEKSIFCGSLEVEPATALSHIRHFISKIKLRLRLAMRT
ncbi:hypothetical protein [Salinicola lusitanus]|uniref:hypothetical protein n=1 Tax=Salinicola lusitanus TaxID=1949085 RepID=UPI00130029F0|nr:hypothetical protein [Salinicola lusitanus]